MLHIYCTESTSVHFMSLPGVLPHTFPESPVTLKVDVLINNNSHNFAQTYAELQENPSHVYKFIIYASYVFLCLRMRKEYLELPKL